MTQGSWRRRASVPLVLALYFLALLVACSGPQSPLGSTPKLLGAESTSRTSIQVRFDRPVGAGADVTDNYVVAGPGGARLRVLAAYPEGATVNLATDAQQEVVYALTVQNVEAGDGSGLVTANSTFGGSNASAPWVASAIALDPDTVLVTFADPSSGTLATMGSSATDVRYYEITPALQIASLEFADSTRARVIIRLTTPQQATTYTVRVTNVTQQSGSRLVDPLHNSASWRGIDLNDTSSPDVHSVDVLGNTTLLVSFSEPVEELAADPSRYRIEYEVSSGGDEPEKLPLVVTDAALNAFGTQVTLTTLPMKEGRSYTLTVEGVRDRAGNTVAENSASFTGVGAGDKEPPRVSNVASTGNRTVLVTFTEPVEGGESSAENASHYKISASLTEGSLATQAVLLVSKAELVGPTTVALTTYSQSDLRYRLEVVNIKDLAGNQIAPPDRFHDPSVLEFTGTAPTAADNADPDGDGLSDAAEQKGWIVTVRNADGSTTSREVTSDPGLEDTDGDGIGDLDESIYRTDPRSPDSDGDGLSDYQELNETYSEPNVQDSDGDGLVDGLEFNYFLTSPLSDDTDGDQIPDDEEILTANRNPLSADLPRHAIEVGDIYVEYLVEFFDEAVSTTEAADEKTVQTTITQTQSNELSSSSTETQEWYAKASLQTEVSASYPGGFGASATFTAEAGVGASGTYVQSETSKQESQRLYEDSLVSTVVDRRETKVSRTVTGGRLIVPVTLRNVNDIAFTMQNIELTALIPDPRDPSRLRPVATLYPPAGSSGVYNLGTIDTTLGPIRFDSAEGDVNPDLLDWLMANQSAIVLKVSNFDITDEFGNFFSYQQQDVTERTAPLLIDFGDGRVERHWVATNIGRAIEEEGNRVIFDSSGKPVGITLRQALEDVVGLAHYDVDDSEKPDPSDREAYLNSYETDGDAIVRVRDVEIAKVSGQHVDYQAWHLISESGIDPGKTVDDIILKRGSSAALVFVTDEDGDQVPRRVEYRNGTIDDPSFNPYGDGIDFDSTDSDGDGVDDYIETYASHEVRILGRQPYRSFSNPANPDSDGDGLGDFAERGTTSGGGIGTDPRRIDTDGDGACDGRGVPGCVEDQYPLDPTKTGRPPLIAEYIFDGMLADDSLLIDGFGDLDLTISGSSSCRGDEVGRTGQTLTAYWLNDPVRWGDAGCGTSSTPYAFLETSTDPGIAEEFSFAVWLRPKSGADFVLGMVRSEDGAKEPGLHLRIEGSQYEFTVPHEFGNDQETTVAAPAAYGQWELVVGTISYDAATDVTDVSIYVVPAGSNPLKVTPADTASFDGRADTAFVGSGGDGDSGSGGDSFLIGSTGDSSRQYQGAIDDLRLFDGALSPLNILDLYAE